jgi:hypothetical protein
MVRPIKYPCPVSRRATSFNRRAVLDQGSLLQDNRWARSIHRKGHRVPHARQFHRRPASRKEALSLHVHPASAHRRRLGSNLLSPSSLLLLASTQRERNRKSINPPKIPFLSVSNPLGEGEPVSPAPSPSAPLSNLPAAPPRVSLSRRDGAVLCGGRRRGLVGVGGGGGA